MSNIQFRLAESQTKSVSTASTKERHGRFRVQFKNNKVILVRGYDKQDALLSVTGLPLDWPKIQGDSNNPGTVQMSNFT